MHWFTENDTPNISATLHNIKHLWHKHNRILGTSRCSISAAVASKSQHSCKLVLYLLKGQRQAFIQLLLRLYSPPVSHLWLKLDIWSHRQQQLDGTSATQGHLTLIRCNSTASGSPFFCFIYFTAASSIARLLFFFLFCFFCFNKGIMSAQDKFWVQAEKFVDRNAN